MDDVMFSPDKLRGREASQEVAVERVVRFAQQFGEASLNLACHAAFPLALTPDLLYHIWANFVPQAPWTAVADVLLSRLCREVGCELYEMDLATRNLLLQELKEDERLGQQRLNKLANFLTDYVTQQLYSDDPDLRDLAQAQRWTALAYTRPDEAAYELTEALSELIGGYNRQHRQETGAELIRVTSLVETLAEPLAEFWPLLVWARTIGDLEWDDLEGKVTQLVTALEHGRQVQVGKGSLPEQEPVLNEIEEVQGRVAGVLSKLLESTRQVPMTSSRKIRLIDVDRLADECADQTARFFSRTEHDTGYCYELFRRAIVGRNSYAWEKIYDIYQPLVASWVSRHSGLGAAGEEVDYFVNCAFDKIWSAVNEEKFGQFQDLASLLRYLQMCVHSVIVDYARSNQISTIDLDLLANLPSPDSPLIEKNVTDELERLRLWEMIARLTRDEREVIVLKYSFVYDLKPSQIYAANPDQFESLEELYRVKRNLLNRLRRNQMLRQFLR